MGQTPRELMNEKRGSNVVKNLEARNFEAYYCATGEEALKKSAGADSRGGERILGRVHDDPRSGTYKSAS